MSVGSRCRAIGKERPRADHLKGVQRERVLYFCKGSEGHQKNQISKHVQKKTAKTKIDFRTMAAIIKGFSWGAGIPKIWEILMNKLVGSVLVT